MTNNEFDLDFTTRAGGNFGGNSQLTQHIMNRKTHKTLCGRDTSKGSYTSGWTSRFDASSFQFDDDEFGRGDCQRCAKSGRKLGFADTMFHPQRQDQSARLRGVEVFALAAGDTMEGGE